MMTLLSEVTGTVWKIEVPVGAALAEGDVVVIVESMKMEIPIGSPCAGLLREVLVAEGDPVSEGQPLAVVG
jgi:acetyl-CoA carboxylase biotin carboxyl carrier protein